MLPTELPVRRGGVEAVAGSPLLRSLRRPLGAGIVLLLAYLALSLLLHPDGTLGTDTGAKVATLEVMGRSGDLDPDVGYWAERWDPAGTLHPLYQAAQVGERWVIVTTLPMLFVAQPLHDLGGVRAALLLPMLGAVAAAFAARAIARRVRPGAPGEGWAAFWLCGLASPVAIYALDFWEHSVGVALMGWGLVALLEVRGSSGARAAATWAALGGAGFGAAATMRTEALVFAVVAVGLTGATILLGDRSLPRSVAALSGAGAGLVVPLWLNTLLERAVLGTAARASRATGTVANAAASNDSRVGEALLTGLSLHPTMEAMPYVLGAAVLALLVFVSRRASSPVAEPGLVVIGCCALVGLYLLRFAEGLGFVPSLVAATPFAGVGLALGWRSRPARLPMAVAVLSLTVVWALQYTGGAAPQWGGRYILTAGLVLGAVGAARFADLDRVARLTISVLAVGTTVFGVLWLGERTHAVARVGDELVALEEPVIVSGIEHLPRELGSRYLDKLFLTAPGPDERGLAGEVVRQAGYDSFAYVQRADAAAVDVVPGYVLVDEERLALLSDVDLRVSRFRAAGG